MESGPNSNADREASLRRVAIVLSSLPSSVTQELISSIEPKSRSAISRAISNLSDVDPLERRRAFQAFRVSIQQNQDPMPAAKSATGVSGVPTANDAPQLSNESYAARVVPGDDVRIPADVRDNPAAYPPATVAPMSFLDDVDEALLLNLLAGEHPQTVAVVLASVSPQKAGRVLPQLTARTQTETLSRIGRLDRLPESVITEIADHFQERLRRHQATSSDKPGRSALDAILANMPNRTRATSDSPHSVDPRSGTELRSPNLAPAGDMAAASINNTPGERSDNFPSMDDPTRELATKIQIAEHTLAPKPEPASANPPHGNDGGDVASVGTSASWLSSTDGIAKRLETMPPADLCAALGRVDTRVAMLALCGLPTRVCEAALSQLPKSEAKKVRSAMTSLGSMNLRDIDDAKEAVARASIQATEPIPMAA